MKKFFGFMEHRFGLMNTVFITNVINMLMNTAPYFVFGSIIHRAYQVKFTDELAIAEAFVMLVAESLSVIIYKRWKKYVHMSVKYLLTLDLILFWGMATMPLDLRDFAFISTVDGFLILGLYQQCVKRYFLRTITGSKERQYYDNRTTFWKNIIRGVAIIAGFKFTEWPIQKMLLVICIISTPGSMFSYIRYKWLRSKALEKK